MSSSELVIPHDVLRSAVQQFWLMRTQQATAQEQRGIVDQGTRGSVTGGRHLDGFRTTIVNLLVAVGVPRTDIYVRGTAVPGFYRPTKQWDLLVVRSGRLLAALELKSQVGSLGNNFNNRVEESIGNAVDLWTAYREGALGAGPEPWLGYLFLLEDGASAHRPVGIEEPHFPAFPEFAGLSYAGRYAVLCRKLVLERQYHATCLLLSDPRLATTWPNYTEPLPGAGAESFLAQLLRHVRP